MVTKEEAKEKIKELIEDFRLNYSRYKHLTEADIETKLVEELFVKVLGWNKDDFNKQAKAGRGEKSGHADYAFYIKDKLVFFLEAKKIGISLDKEADKQVVSYALSRRVPFAVSTNFEHLKIFCVEQENGINNKFRVFDNPQSYITDFDNLWFLSKESFEQGLILKKAESEGRLKKRVSIDKALLEDLMHIRKLISDDIEKKYTGKYQINEKDEIVQRIIDRLIFVRRCEDIGINPDDIKLEELRHLPHNKIYHRLMEIFKKYNSVYNSGLFAIAKDNDCDVIDIDGGIIQKLAYYLYESKDKGYIYNFDWIDADVLGQVYEQYLGIILAQTKSGKAKLKAGTDIKKQHGIYYTPTYIVDYIVKNTVGELLKDKKVKASEIKILDPACGSGSFLIKAFDYLAESIEGSDESKQHRLDSQGNYSVKTEILKNNIYGVDLDNKAVEITKLNLLLKAAEKGRKLPEEIDAHIRHGNSLIDNDSVAGLNAFKWIGDFQEGSFDVVIGNPPYIRIQTLEDNSVDFFNSHYKSATKNYDIYALFVEKGFSLLKEGGMLGFILPSKFFNADYGEGLRKVIAENKALYKIVNFKDFQVFDGATTYTCLLFLKKEKNKQFEYFELADRENLPVSRTLISFKFKKSKQEQPKEAEPWNFVSNESKGLMGRLDGVKLRLGNICSELFVGLQTSADPIYIIQILEEEKNFYEIVCRKTNKRYKIEKEIIKPILMGKDIHRWIILWRKLGLIFPYEIKDSKAVLIEESVFKEKFPKAWEYFLDNKKFLDMRENGKWKHKKNWHAFVYEKNLSSFSQLKILTQVLASKNSFTFDEKGDYYFVGGGNAGGYGITLKDEYSKDYYFILSVLNSKLLEFYLKKISTPFRGGYYSYGKRFIEKLPIIIPSEKEKDKLSELTRKQLERNKLLNSFGDKKTSETAKIKEEIKKTDAEIDELVYKIYGITEEEKKIIEESLK